MKLKIVEKKMWWGYKQQRGNIEIRPFISQALIDKTKANPLVVAVSDPVEADNYVEAAKIIVAQLGEGK
jgi:hypothetical protein